MIGRTAAPAIVNLYANHPDIRPHAGGKGELDLTDGVLNPANVFLIGDHGGICWVWTAPDTYEGHVMLTRQGRGRWGFAALRQSVAFIKDMGARHLWARVHPDRREVAIYAAHAGLKECGTHRADCGDGPVDWRIFDWRDECPQQ